MKCVYDKPFCRNARRWATTRRLLTALVILLFTASLRAQSFTNLYTFTGGNDGGSPAGGVVLSGANLYGTAGSGGMHGYGAVFAVGTNGGGFTNLYSFANGSDGAYPVAGLLLTGTNLYGVTEAGGVDSAGTVFRVGTSGGGFTNLYTFTGGNDGANPHGSLIQVGTNLFGTTYDGGPFSYGTVFRVSTNGSGFTNLYSFTGNGDGANPQAGLMLAGTNLFGTAEFGGNPGVGYGTVFRLGTDGSGFTVVHTFIGGDGADPVATLRLSGTNLYGAGSAGGVYGNGVLFAQSITGTNYTVLHSFSGTAAPVFGGAVTNYDGTTPRGLFMGGTNLWGVAEFGGLHGAGTIFVASATGTNFTTWHAPAGGADGAEPTDGLCLSNDVLYGTAETGGGLNAGTVFSLNLSASLPVITGIHLAGNSLVINASGNGAGTYTLLTSTNLTLSAGQWMPLATNVLSARGSFALTNALNRTGDRIYYILQAR